MDLRLLTAETVPMAPRDIDAGLGKGVLPLVPAAAAAAPAAAPAEAFLTLPPLRPRRVVAPASPGVAAGEAPATPSDAAAALRVLPERAEGARAAAPAEAPAAFVVLLDAPLDCDGAVCCWELFGCCEPPAPPAPPASERVRPERVWRGEPVLSARREVFLTSKKKKR